MKTQDFFKLLLKHEDKSLLFEYTPNKFVGANYHITEVKHTSIDSVDCGGKEDAWQETIIQLWESPSEIDKRDFLKVSKAIEIFERVAELKPFFLEGEVKFEYSNNTFNTAQLFVNDFEIRDDNLIIKLAVEKTDCKAKSICGTTDALVALKEEEPCCSPNGNCC